MWRCRHTPPKVVADSEFREGVLQTDKQPASVLLKRGGVGVNKSVPTLLGIVIILLVIVLVVLVYDLRMTANLAAGNVPVGTVGGQMLTGVEAPTEIIGDEEAIGAHVSASDQETIRPEELRGLTDRSEERAVDRDRLRSGEQVQEHPEGAEEVAGE